MLEVGGTKFIFSENFFEKPFFFPSAVVNKLGAAGLQNNSALSVTRMNKDDCCRCDKMLDLVHALWGGEEASRALNAKRGWPNTKANQHRFSGIMNFLGKDAKP